MKARRGRPPKPKGDVLETPINFRVKPEEKVAFKKAAKQVKMPLSTWIRSVLISAIEKALTQGSNKS